MAEAGDLSPFEWLQRLGPKLIKRGEAIAYWRRYYHGDHDLPAGPSQHKEAFVRFQRLARTNLCLLCAESMVHRMCATGYRDNSQGRAQDNAVWQLWQDAKLDARQFGIYRKAFSRSASYVTVGVDPRKPRTPRVTIEGPETVIVETDPGEPWRRLAALRLWHDDIAKRWLATLYLPGERYHWQTRHEHKTPTRTPALGWDEASWEPRGDPGRSLPNVPVVPFLNCDEGDSPVAEFDPGIDVQNRLNLTILNRLTAERYGAFRQRGLVNYEPEEDSATGLVISPFNPGIDQVWTVPPNEIGQPEPRLFDFAQTDTSMMLRGAEADMAAFCSITLTPLYYMPGDLVNISADTIAALDAGHIAKVKQRMALWGEGLEEVAQLMADVAELDRDLSDGEIVWARPENFQPASVADYATKLVSAQIPVTMVAEEIGWSPQRVQQLRAELAAESLRAALATPPAGAARPPTGAGRPTTGPASPPGQTPPGPKSPPEQQQ